MGWNQTRPTRWFPRERTRPQVSIQMCCAGELGRAMGTQLCLGQDGSVPLVRPHLGRHTVLPVLENNVRGQILSRCIQVESSIGVGHGGAVPSLPASRWSRITLQTQPVGSSESITQHARTPEEMRISDGYGDRRTP
jgi:hypothetical protein